MKLAWLLALALALTSCSNKAPAERKEAVAATDEPRPIQPAQLAAPTPAPAPAPSPAAGIPNDFPRECTDYAALIDKLKACDQIGGARAALVQAYDSVRSAWAMVPAERRAEVAVQCKTQADSLRNAAAATCSW